MSESPDMSAIQTALQSAGFPWIARENDITRLPADQRRLRLGAENGPSAEELAQIEAANQAAEAALTITLPASIDWRAKSGRNYITPVKDQGGCGSCVAFGAAATVEAMFRIQRNNPTMDIDLSEAHLFYCIARSQGRNCGNGWFCEAGVDAFKHTGVVDEACYPYTDSDQNCSNRCSDWQNRLTKITGWHAITNRTEMKEWLSTRGPLTSRFDVYSDFYAYSSGVYKHVSGGFEGGHCIAVVGYNDPQGCWICKNSWGSGWGDSGYFRIAYGECGIDARMWAVEGIEETGWLSTRVAGLWTINEARNAWVYLSDIGWRRIAYDNDTIFFDLLTLLVSAKAGNRPVSVYQQNAIIKQVYVY